jgi:hypothetical protein
MSYNLTQHKNLMNNHSRLNDIKIIKKKFLSVMNDYSLLLYTYVTFIIIENSKLKKKIKKEMM